MKLENWGEIDYLEAREKQKSHVEEVIDKKEERIVICSHPPVVTLGKKSNKEDIKSWKGRIVATERGGKATYHGPGQIVVYPIIDLRYRNKDIGGHLRNLEEAVIRTLKDCRLSAKGNILHSGVWVGEKKIASIGVAVRRWVTYHGLAFNLFLDPLAFTGIAPCGLQKNVMTGLDQLMEQKVSRGEVESILVRHLFDLLNI
ncbi:MAG: lipoyl(octanoyl) transferase LipB [Halobacteriovoraceae bacterium]|nr:lipoyl(octanoyl) transferase LipB [Halobacteriovoraceae bacterium]